MWTHEELNYLMGNYRRELIFLSNTEGGRHLLGIKDRDPIFFVSPNSFGQIRGKQGNLYVCQGKFYLRDIFAKKFLPFFSYVEALHQMREGPVGAKEYYECFLHYFDLVRTAQFPRLFLTQQNFNTGSGDGDVGMNTGYAVWADCKAATTGDSLHNGGPSIYIDTYLYASDNKYYLDRAFLPVDTSAIGAGATVTAVVFNYTLGRYQGSVTHTFYMIPTSQASTSTLANSDLGNVTFTDLGNTSYNSVTGTKQITLNATGRAAISLTGFTKMGQVQDNDFNNSAPVANEPNQTINSQESGAGSFYDTTWTSGVTANSNFLPLL